jgi:hypothetical protein
MSLRSVLGAVGKDLGHVAQWLDVGLKAAEPIIDLLDPPLGPMVTALEGVLGSIPASGVTTVAQLQQLSSAVAAGYAAGIKAAQAQVKTS